MRKYPFIVILSFLAASIPAYVDAESVSFELKGETIDVSYEGQNVVINNVQPDLDFASLILDVQVTGSPATLEITLERSVIDSKDNQDNDIPFIVLEDGFDIPFEVVDVNEKHRVLSMELSQGTQEVEIIGTELAPEPDDTEPVPEPPTQEPEPEPKDTQPPQQPPTQEPEPKPEEKEQPQKQQEQPKSEEKPKVECGPGTVLRNGTCVLPEQCGPGTVFKDGECVLAPQQTKETTPKQQTRDLVFGVMASFIIALIVAFILWLISKGSRTKTS